MQAWFRWFKQGKKHYKYYGVLPNGADIPSIHPD